MKESKIIIGILISFIALGTAFASDFVYNDTADWLSGVSDRVSTDDNSLYFGWTANMNQTPSCFNTSTQGSTWSYSGGEARLIEAVTYNAGIFISAKPINISLPFVAETKVKMNTSGTFTPYTFGIWQKAVQPSVTTASLFNVNSRLNTFQDEFGAGYIFSTYRSPSDAVSYWNGTQWVGSYTQEYNGAMDTYYIYKYISNGTHIRQRLEDSAGSLLTETSNISWTSIKNDGNYSWIISGDGINDTQYGNITIDYITVSFNSGSWTSPIHVMDWNRLKDLTINHTGLSSNIYIDKIEILSSSNSVLDTYNGDITNGTSTTLTEEDFNNGLIDTDRNFKVKLYYIGDGSSTPSISNIEGNYEFTESYFIQEAIEQIAMLVIVGIIIFALLLALLDVDKELIYLMSAILIIGIVLILINLYLRLNIL